MKAYFKSLLRFYGALAVVLILLGVSFTWDDTFGFVLIGMLFVLPAAGLTLVAGTVLYIFRGFQTFTELNWKRRLPVALSPVLALCVFLFCASPLLWTGGYLGSLTRLTMNHRHYAAIIASAQQSSAPSSYEEDEGVTFSVDPGPPVRVAFNPAGILDNWSAIVYDPTGEMMQADGFDPMTGKFAAPERITKLFGGDLVQCRSLWGDYYRCSFT